MYFIAIRRWVALRSAVAAPVAVAASSLLRHGAPMTRPESRSALSLGLAVAGPPPPGPRQVSGGLRRRAWGGDSECWPDAAGARRAPWRAGAASQPPRRTWSELVSVPRRRVLVTAASERARRASTRSPGAAGGVRALRSPLNSEAAWSVSAPCGLAGVRGDSRPRSRCHVESWSTPAGFRACIPARFRGV